jgi:hypothetical protein
VPFTPARANLSELAEQVKAGATWTSRRSPPKRSRNSESYPPARPTACECSPAVTI